MTILIDRSQNPYIMIKTGTKKELQEVKEFVVDAGIIQAKHVQLLDGTRYGTEEQAIRMLHILMNHSAWMKGGLIERFIDSDYRNETKANALFKELLATYTP